MGWRKIRIFRKQEQEQAILTQHGWPSKEARDAMVTLYYHDTIRTVGRALRRMGYARISTQDAAHEVLVFVLEVSDRWNPSRGAFSQFIEVWGIHPLERYIARFRYPTSQGVVTVAQGNTLEFEGMDRVMALPDEPMPSANLLIHSVTRSGGLTQREQSVFEVMAMGYSSSEIGCALGVSHQRVAQLTAAIRRKLERLGLVVGI
jgi:DNA-binding CsgD family transcriptional regulator